MKNKTAILVSTVVMTAVFLSACQTAPQSTTTSASTSTVKTVSVDSSYQSPGGEEKVGFHVGVDAAGVITDVKTDILSQNPKGVVRQTAFSQGILAAVKGKKLADLTQIDRVGGSSLTTAAFNEALAKLKAEL